MKEKSTWGGSRGGGRPKGPRSIAVCIRLSQDSVDHLDKQQNKSEYIDNLIKKDMKADE